MWTALLDRWPRGHTLDEHDWRRRHRLLLAVLVAHAVGLTALGPALGRPLPAVLVTAAVPAGAAAAGLLLRRNRVAASVLVALGLVGCSAVLSWPAHLFVVVGLVAIYQSWRPILAVAAVTVLGHGFGPRLAGIWPGLPLFSPTEPDPWQRGLLQGAAVLAVGLAAALVWRATEHVVAERDGLAGRLTEVELARRHFVSELLVSLARRSQSATYRQLEILARLRVAEHDPETSAELSRLDHLAGRARRTAENLLLLAGAQPARAAGEPVPLRTVVQAAAAETEDADRVRATLDDRAVVLGRAVPDVTHLLAELIENAARFSPPDSPVTVQCRPDHRHGGRLVTVEDRGVSMPPEVLAEANAMLAEPREVDLSVSQRLGLPVVARLAQRHEIEVTLTAGEGAGVLCAVALPAGLFTARLITPDGEPDSPTGTIQAVPADAPARVAESATPPAVAAPEPTETAGPAAAAHQEAEPSGTTFRAGPARPTDPQTSSEDPTWTWLGGTRQATADEELVRGGDSPSGVDLFRPLTEAPPDDVPNQPDTGGDSQTTAIPIVPSTDPAPARSDSPDPETGDPAHRIPRPTPPQPNRPAAAPTTVDPADDVGSATAATHRIQLPALRSATPPPIPTSDAGQTAPAAPPRAPTPRPLPAQAATPAEPVVAPQTDPATPPPNPARPNPTPAHRGAGRIPLQTTPSDADLFGADAPADPAPLPVRRSPAVGAPGRRGTLPGPFGSTESWSGWWEPDAELPRDVVPSPRSRPPVGMFRSDGRPNATTTERARQPFDYPPTTLNPSAQPDTPSASPDAPHPTGPVTWVESADPTPAPTPDEGRSEPEDNGIELGKRVPQANLSSRLRDPLPDPGPLAPVDPEQSAEAATALSRYQASRHAARMAVGETADTVQPRPGSDARPVAVEAGSEPPRERHDPGPGDGAVIDRASADAGPEAAGDERSTAQDAAPPAVPGDPNPDATDGQP